MDVVRLWLDFNLQHYFNVVINWNDITPSDYLNAMKHSIIDETRVIYLLSNNLTSDLSMETFLKSLDQSYIYEEMNTYQSYKLHEENKLIYQI